MPSAFRFIGANALNAVIVSRNSREHIDFEVADVDELSSWAASTNADAASADSATSLGIDFKSRRTAATTVARVTRPSSSCSEQPYAPMSPDCTGDAQDPNIATDHGRRGQDPRVRGDR
jgi:hypothetical protein